MVSVPYTNTRVWEFNRYGSWDHGATGDFTDWLREQGLWESGFWYDNTSLSDSSQRVLLFEDPRKAVLFKLTWGGQ